VPEISAKDHEVGFGIERVNVQNGLPQAVGGPAAAFVADEVGVGEECKAGAIACRGLRDRFRAGAPDVDKPRASMGREESGRGGSRALAQKRPSRDGRWLLTRASS
jgi:hypothetical protein